MPEKVGMLASRAVIAQIKGARLRGDLEDLTRGAEAALDTRDLTLGLAYVRDLASSVHILKTTLPIKLRRNLIEAIFMDASTLGLDLRKVGHTRHDNCECDTSRQRRGCIPKEGHTCWQNDRNDCISGEPNAVP